MGAYKLGQITKDFDTVTKGIWTFNITQLLTIAKDIIQHGPDNASDDFAISYLLQAAQMLAYSFADEVLKAKKEAEPVKRDETKIISIGKG